VDRLILKPSRTTNAEVVLGSGNGKLETKGSREKKTPDGISLPEKLNSKFPGCA